MLIRLFYTQKKQAELLEEELNKDTFKLILGGDCSILLGNAIALKKKMFFMLDTKKVIKIMLILSKILK